MTPADMAEVIPLDGPDRAGSLEKWRELIQQFALFARRFELHCWEDEETAIALAKQYGEEKANNWAHGRIFAGAVTPAFVQMLLTQPLPEDCETAQRLTPFFSVFLDNGFSSEHYGTEIIIAEEDHL